MEQKIYKKPEPKKSKVNWKKLLGILLIAATFAVVIIIAYPWIKYFVEKDVLKKEAISIVEIPNVDQSSEYKQDIFFNLETANVKIVAPVVEGVDEVAFKKGIGHHPGTPWPDDKRGNVILAGHSSDLDPHNQYGQVFRDLGKVEIGDQVSIVYPDSEYVYKVEAKYEINPDDITLFGQDGGPRLTFYTCSPVFTTWRRLVYIAKLETVKTENK